MGTASPLAWLNPDGMFAYGLKTPMCFQIVDALDVATVWIKLFAASVTADIPRCYITLAVLIKSRNSNQNS